MSKSYQERKEASVCTRKGCDAPASETSFLCEAHRLATAATMARVREKRRRRGFCPRCGKHRVKRSEYACRPCLTYLGQLGTRIVATNVAPSGDLAVRTRDKDNRLRYHGKGSRGRQPLIETDKEDLKEAQRALSRGTQGLIDYWTEDVQSGPKALKADQRAVALAKLEQCQRWIDEVLVRNGVKPALVDPDEEEIAGPTRKGGR